MRDKTKEEISDNSDSDDKDNVIPTAEIISPVLKHYANKYSESSSFIPDERSANNASVESDETLNAHLGVELDSGNESNYEKLLDETADLHFRKEKSSREKSDVSFVNSIFNIEELTSDDEIYMLQCPENYVKEDLCNKSINFTKSKQSIICKGKVYSLEVANSDKTYITLAVPGKTSSGCLVKLPLKGHIIIQKDINMVYSKPDFEIISDSHRVEFPNDIKARHPLLGAEWKSHIDLANKAINDNNSAKKKNKKIKKEKNHEYLEVENKKFKRKNSETEFIVHKKKKYE